MEKTILIVEDETSILSFISLNIRKNGYRVLEAKSGEEALLYLPKEKIDIVILDIMLPGMDGYQVCQKLKEYSPNIGIIMLTARTFEEDRIRGLLEGADDYMTKPFIVKELLARIVSLSRRMDLNQTDGSIKNTITTNHFSLDLKKKQISLADKRLDITATEYALLALLIQHQNRIFDRNELLDLVWGTLYVGDPKVVDVNIRRIRKKIEPDDRIPIYLMTARGQGYYWRDET